MSRCGLLAGTAPAPCPAAGEALPAVPLCALARPPPRLAPERWKKPGPLSRNSELSIGLLSNVVIRHRATDEE